MTLAGLAVSGLLCAAGVWSLIRISAAAIAAAPASWRERFASEYEEALRFRIRDAFLSGETLGALVLWLPTFVLLDLVDVILGVQLGVVAAVSAWATAGERQRRQEHYAAWRAKGLEPIPRNPRLAWSYDAAAFAAFLGSFGTACFAARALVDLAGG